MRAVKTILGAVFAVFAGRARVIEVAEQRSDAVRWPPERRKQKMLYSDQHDLLSVVGDPVLSRTIEQPHDTPLLIEKQNDQ